MAITREKGFKGGTDQISLMEKILILIKHRAAFLWQIIEWGNAVTFSFLYRKQMESGIEKIIQNHSSPPFLYRRLVVKDASRLHELIHSQNPKDLEYFNPHQFDPDSLRKQFHNRAFLMMGAFDGEKMIGYFFLRFFANRKCFVGRLVDGNYRGKGVGRVMNRIMYETAWAMNFRCLSTISRNNHFVMQAHSKNDSLKILKELNNDYLLVEFIKTDKPIE